MYIYIHTQKTVKFIGVCAFYRVFLAFLTRHTKYYEIVSKYMYIIVYRKYMYST